MKKISQKDLKRSISTPSFPFTDNEIRQFAHEASGILSNISPTEPTTSFIKIENDIEKLIKRTSKINITKILKLASSNIDELHSIKTSDIMEPKSELSKKYIKLIDSINSENKITEFVYLAFEKDIEFGEIIISNNCDYNIMKNSSGELGTREIPGHFVQIAEGAYKQTLKILTQAKYISQRSDKKPNNYLSKLTAQAKSLFENDTFFLDENIPTIRNAFAHNHWRYVSHGKIELIKTKTTHTSEELVHITEWMLDNSNAFHEAIAHKIATLVDDTISPLLTVNLKKKFIDGIIEAIEEENTQKLEETLIDLEKITKNFEK